MAGCSYPAGFDTSDYLAGGEIGDKNIEE